MHRLAARELTIDGRVERLGRAARLALASVGMAAALAGCRSAQPAGLTQSMVDSRQMAMRGQDAIQGGRWDEASQWFGRAVEACPANERARAGFAETKWQRGQTKAAIDEMREAVRLSADDAEMQVRLGEMQLAVGDVDGAEACAAAAIRAQWQGASAWALSGDVERARGRPEEALRCYHRALACQERMPRVQLAVAEIYEQQDRPLRALATLDALVDQYAVGQAPPDLLVRRGWALRRLGRNDDALECFAAAWKQPNANWDVAMYLAECQWAAGQKASAQLTIQEGLRRNPTAAGLQSLAAQIQASDARMASRADGMDR